jgi:hypothetical protein
MSAWHGAFLVDFAQRGHASAQFRRPVSVRHPTSRRCDVGHTRTSKVTSGRPFPMERELGGVAMSLRASGVAQVEGH